MFDLSVIIVNYNVKELLENCIQSVIAASKNLKTEIIIVDNNSFDGSVNYISNKFADFSNVKIIPSEVNLGFAKANNLAVEKSQGKYLLILNPDTILQEDTLEKCLAYYEDTPSIGCLTCKLILPNGKLDLACRRSFPTPSVALYRIFGLSKLFPKSRIFGKYNLTYLDENQTYEVDAVVGAFMFLSKNVFELIGGFDEDYFMYGEDLDLCYKIKKAGYKIFYYSGTSIIHYKGESTKKSSVSYVNNFYGAMKIFVEKNLHQTSLLLNLLIKILIFYRASVSYFKRFILFVYPVIIDLLLIVSAMLISIRLRFEFFPVDAYTIPIIVYSVIWIISLSINATYKKNNILSLIKPLNGILIGFFINSSITYFFNEFAFSRVVVLRTTAYSFIGLILWRLLISFWEFIKRKDLFYKDSKTLVVGKNAESENFMNKLNRRPDSEYSIVGFISPERITPDYIGNLNNIKDVIKAYLVKHIIFAKSALSNQQILDSMWSLKDMNLDFKILSGESDFIMGKSAIDKIEDIYLMNIEYNIKRKFNIFVKRIFDICFGLISLFSVYPLVLFITHFSKNTDEHKFFKKILLIPKVLTGKYSFVGKPTWDENSTGKQYLGKNGLTGLVQINFYKNLSIDEVEYYNFYYAKNQSIALDLEIIIKTISLYFFKKRVL